MQAQPTSQLNAANSIMNSPGKAHFQNNQMHMQQSTQQAGMINRANILPSQSPNTTIYQNSTNPRLIPQVNATNLANVSPASTPIPPIVYQTNTSDSNINDSNINNWQGSTNNQQQYMINNRVNPGSIGSPAPNMGTASPIQNVQPQLQPQQQQAYGQFRPQIAPGQQQQQLDTQQQYLQSLVQQFKAAPTTAEKNQKLLEIKNLSPALFSRIMTSLQTMESATTTTTTTI